MRSQTAQFLFSKARAITTSMHDIRVTDPCILESNDSTSEQLPYQLTSQIPITSGSWNQRALRTIARKKGNNIDFAALSAFQIMETVLEYSTGASVEVISGLNHPVVVLNREGSIQDIESWGENPFIMDPWYQNQFPQSYIDGVFWMFPNHLSEGYHQIRQEIILNSYKLTVLMTINEGTDEPSYQRIPGLKRFRL